MTTQDGNKTATCAVTVTTTTVAVTGVTVSPTTASVNVGSTTTLTATVAPANATNKTVSWNSNNTSVATVNSSGVVTGVAAGSATITVTTQDGSKTATCAITVTISSGESVYNIYNESGTNHFANDGGTIGTYAMNNSTITSGAPEGSEYRKITVTNNYASYRFEFPSTGLDKSSWSTGFIEFLVKTTADFDIYLEDATGASKYIPLSGYISKSGNWETAKIPVSVFTGVNLTKLRRIGFYRLWNAAISMDFDNVRITRSTDNVPVTGVTVSPTTASVNVGATSALIATVAPANATNKTVSWSSNNTSVATVNSSGVVTGVAAGSATITVTTQDGNKTATCAVTVTATTLPVTGVTVSPTIASVKVGATTALTATVAPANATNKTVSWSSSNTSVATVNSSGVVTGVAAGSATITVTTQDGNKTATCAITVTISSGESVYNIYNESGTNHFANDGGTIGTYAMNTSTITSGAPEGSEYRKITVTNNYASYRFEFPSAGLDKSSWSTGFIEFLVKTTADFDIYLEDATGASKYIPLSGYISKSGNWESAKIPVSVFTGVNLTKLRRIGFYRLWSASISMDFDNVRITGSNLKSASALTTVESSFENDFRVYPNPAIKGEQVYLEASPMPTHFTICDANGRYIRQISAGAESILVIETSDLPAGLYIVSGATSKGIIKTKLIISR